MQKMKKVLAILLTLSMVLSYVPVPALAEEGTCPHHAHDGQCGYVEKVEGSPCGHVSCSEACLTKQVVECIHDHEAARCIYTPAVEPADCDHVHGDCNYVAPQDEVRCTCDPQILHGETCASVLTEGAECSCTPSEVHGEGCAPQPAVAEYCGHTHGNCAFREAKPESWSCGHVCSKESGCVRMECAHVCPGDNCGYVAAAGSDCTYVCKECQKQDCTGEENCPADEHSEGCAKKANDEKSATDQAAADAVAALIEALPSLEEIQAKPMEEQGVDYNQVYAAYDAYGKLAEEQKALLPPAEDVFKPYFDYFNGQTEEVASHSHLICGSSCACTDQTHYDYNWQAWDGTTKLMNGNYYLTKDLELDSTLILDYNYSTNLCLNGYSIKCSGKVFDIYSYRTLRITDCVGGGKIETTNADCTIGNNNILSVFGGTILNSSATGSAIYAYSDTDTYVRGGRVEGNGYAAIHTFPGSNIKITGGTVHNNGNECAISGQCLAGDHKKSALTISGGSVTSNNKVSCITVGCGNFTMNGGYVGGDVYTVEDGAIISISGGTIDGTLVSWSEEVSITGGEMEVVLYGTNANADIYNGTFRGNCVFENNDTAVGGGVFSNCDSVSVLGQTWIYGGVFEQLNVEKGPLYLSGTPEIDTLVVYEPALLSAQNVAGSNSYNGEIISIWLNNPYTTHAWKDGDIIVKNVTSDTVAQKFKLKESDAQWMYLERSGNDLVLRVIPHGSWGGNVEWSFVDGLLTISGTGVIKPADSGRYYPWANYLDSITAVVVESGITEIPKYTFEYMESVESIELPDTLETLWLNAFNDCGCLNNLMIPASVQTIDGTSNTGYPAFIKCESLTDVYYMGTEAEWRTIPKAQYVTSANSQMKMHFLVLHEKPATCTESGLQSYYTFDDTSVYSDKYDLEKNIIVTLEEMPAIDHKWGTDNICENCGSMGGTCGQKLTWILDAEGILTISGTGAMPEFSYSGAPWYDYRTSIVKVVVESGVTSVGKYAFHGSSKLTSVIIPDGIVSIGDYAFSYCDSLKNITIPESVTNIGIQAFRYCVDLTSLILPDNVANIGNGAFSDCSSLTSISLPAGITSIVDSAFTSCSSLSNVVIPDSVTSIGASAFAYCDSLTSITIPENVTSIGSGAFAYCSFTSLTIPKGVVSIGSGAFSSIGELEQFTVDPDNTAFISDDSGVLHNKEMTLLIQAPGKLSGSYNISESVTSIGDNAFSNCTNLTDIIIPNGVTTIGRTAFWACTALTSVTIPEGVTSIGSHTFGSCNSLTSITIPEKVNGIGYEAFAWCDALTEIRFKGDAPSFDGTCFKNTAATAYYPENNNTWTEEVMEDYGGDITWVAYGETHVHNFDSDHKCECGVIGGSCGKNLTWVLSKDGTLTISGTGDMIDYYNGDGGPWYEYREKIHSVIINSGVTSIGSSAFMECDSLTNITIPKSVTSIDSYAFLKCSSLTSLVIPENVTCIGYSAFNHCSNLTSITIPEGVTNIEDYAFYGCSSLTNIIIPKGVTSIEYSTFGCCSNLTSITIPEGVTNIEDYAFSDCSSLISITIPKGVTSIGSRAFKGCNSLTSITIPEGVTSIGNYAFENCSSLTSANIPNGVTCIGASVFEGCSNLTSITIPEGVASIGSWAFKGCNSLASITIPENVTSIGDCAFKECSSLTSITIPEGVTSIGKSVFEGCSSLASVTLPENVTSVGEYAFAHCNSLASITIPKSVTSIGDYAFVKCSSLTSITIPEGVASFGSYAFLSCGSLTSITILEGVTSIGNNAFENCSSLTIISIPESVTSIGNAAFASCKHLDHVFFHGFSKDVITVAAGNSYLSNAIWHYEADAADHVHWIEDCEYSGLFCDICNDFITKQKNEFTTHTRFTYTDNGDGTHKKQCSQCTYAEKEAHDHSNGKCICGNKATPSVTAPTANALTYNGQAQAMVKAGSATGGEMQYSTDNQTWSTTIPTGTNAGEYTVYYKVVGDANYTDTDVQSVAVTIAKQQIIISGINWTVPQNAVYSGNEYTAMLNGELPDGVKVTTSGDKATNAGSYTAKAAFSLAEGYSADNYKIVNGEDLTAAWSIEAKNISGAEIILGAALTYTGEEQTQTIESVSIDGLPVTYTVSGNTGTAVQNYTLTITGNSNFKGTASKGWNIKAAAATVATAPKANSLTYTGEALDLIVAGVANGGKMVYSLTENGEYAETIPTGTNAGEYTVWYYVQGDANHADSAKQSMEVTIAKAQAEITVDTTPITVTYGEIVNLPTAASNFGTVSCNKSDAELANAGTYTVTYTVEGTDNYEGDSKTIAVTIEKLAIAEPTVTGTYTYTGSEQTVTLAGVESSMTIASGNKATNAGNYEVVITLDNNHKWADGSDGKVQWNIGKAKAEITVDTTITVIYGEDVELPDATTNFGTVSCDKTAVDLVNAGTYTVTYSVAGTDNYDGTTKTVTVTINAKVIDRPVIEGINEKYLYTGNAFTPVPTAVKDGETVIASSEYTLTYENNIAVGTATVNIVDNEGGNYIVSGSKTFQIEYATSGTCGEDLNWSLAEDGTLTISGEGPMDVILGKKKQPWYYSSEQIKKVVVKEGVTSISQQAFMECPNLEEVVISDTVEEIGALAFYSCESLRSVALPGNLKALEMNLFANCNSLTSLTLPETLKSIGTQVFMGSGLTEITIPGSVESIGGLAFADCDSLKKVYFEGDPPAIHIGDAGQAGSFDKCILTAYYPAGNKNWTGNEMQDYDGEIIWKPYGNPATKLTLSGLDADTYLGQMIGRKDSLRLTTVPADATVDMVYTVTDSSVLEIVDYNDSGCKVIAHKPGTVTVTATDRLSGVSTTKEITIVTPKEITVPYEDDISITSSFVNQYYSFTPAVTGRYVFSSTACEKPYTDALNIYIAKGNSGTLAFGWEYPEGDKCQGYADLEAGVTYQVQPQYAGMTVGRTAKFEVDYLGEAIAVTGINIKAPDQIECEISPYIKPNYSGIYLETELLPADAKGTVAWEISDRNIIDFKDSPERGEFVPKSCGTATVTATCNGYSDSVTITVKEPQALELNQWKEVTHDKGNSTHVYTFTPEKTGEYVITMDSGDTYYPQDIVSVITENDTYASDAEFGYGADTQKWYITLNAGEKYYVKIGAGIFYDYPDIPSYKLKIVESDGLPRAMHLRLLKQTEKTVDFGTYFDSENSHEEILDVKISDESVLQPAGASYGVTTSHKLDFKVIGAGEVTVTATTDSGIEASYTLYVGEKPGNNLYLEDAALSNETTVWIDGIPYPVQKDNSGKAYVELPEGAEVSSMVTYGFHVGTPNDVHTQYPVSMKVWMLKKDENGIYQAHYVKELDNILQYSGSSIRITGNKGIRMITSVESNKKSAMTGAGLAGYKLLEYGTVLAQSSKMTGPLTLGQSYARSNYAYKRGVADPVFAYSGNLVQYTNVLVGFNMDQCKEDIAMRPYMILEDAAGKQVTIYGGTVYRSIGYIAYQNRGVFAPGSAAYNYVWEIIHHVYGNKYDADYKG